MKNLTKSIIMMIYINDDNNNVNDYDADDENEKQQ